MFILIVSPSQKRSFLGAVGMAASKPKPNIEEIVTCVTSSNLDRLTALTSDRIPIVPQFPLCGQWRKQIALLHLAAAYGSLTSMQYLIGKTDVNVQTEDGWTPIACAAANRHLRSVEFLLKKGADPNIPNAARQTPLHLAASVGSTDIILLLLDAGVDANAQTDAGWNAVHYAAKEALSSVIDPLVIHGADIDLRSLAGQTPLHIAAQSGADVFAAALLSFGAGVDTQDRTGAGPLHLALEKARFNVAKILLQNGADLNLRNTAGQAPIDVVPASAAPEARAFLQHWEDWDELVESVEFHGRRLGSQ